MRAAQRRVSGAALGRRRKRTWACGSCGAVHGAEKPPRGICIYCQGELIQFDSKAEANRFDALMQKLKRGEISDLRRQVRYVLIDGTHTGDGKPIAYVADFVYRERPAPGSSVGKQIIEDVKGGAMTPLARLKLALLRQRLAGPFVEVRVTG